MIDWNKQWELHAPNFSNGYAHVNLSDFGGPPLRFRMKPGAGFGDLSHPTTQLMLQLMPTHINQPVLDIGCGSGILSIAAKLRGAPKVIGIDIDQEALRHANENARLNGVDCVFKKTLKDRYESPLIVMNMISSEQKNAWENLPPISSYTLIVSGFLSEESFPFQIYGAVIKQHILNGWKGVIIQK